MSKKLRIKKKKKKKRSKSQHLKKCKLLILNN